MVKPSTEAVQPLGSTFSEQEVPQTMERSSHWSQGRHLEMAVMGRGVVSISISSELKAGLDAEVWLWRGGRGDAVMKNSVPTEALGRGTPGWCPSGAPNVRQQYSGATDHKCG